MKVSRQLYTLIINNYAKNMEIKTLYMDWQKLLFPVKLDKYTKVNIQITTTGIIEMYFDANKIIFLKLKKDSYKLYDFCLEKYKELYNPSSKKIAKSTSNKKNTKINPEKY